jgi:hypothetical protein
VVIRGHKIEISIHASDRNHIKINGRDFLEELIAYAVLKEINGPIKIEVERNKIV